MLRMMPRLLQLAFSPWVTTFLRTLQRPGEAQQALLKRFGLFGPPGIIFFGADGRELGGTRVIGYEDADSFLASLRKAEAAQTPPQS